MSLYMQPTEQTSIAVIGTGPAGLLCKYACLKKEWDVKAIGPSYDPAYKDKDTRTTALFSSSIEFLKNLGLWEKCSAHATPLKGIRLIDASKNLFRAPETHFDCKELGLEQFGFNIANADLLEILFSQIEKRPGNKFFSTQNVTKIDNQSEALCLHCSDGTTLNTQLIIGADGRNSTARKYAGITTKNWSYPQVAIACNFNHQYEHQFISNEFHYETGPCTTVPLPGNRSSLVWVVSPHDADRLMALPEDIFCKELHQNLRGLLGDIQKIGKRSSFPLSGLTANQFAKNGIALVGEAAHVFPPIGAQGLNLGLRDVAMAIEVIAANMDASNQMDINQIVNDYDKRRQSDIVSRTIAIDMLNRSLLYNFLPVQLSRSFILGILNKVGPLRKFVMQQGMQPSYSIPELMKPGNKI